MNKGKRLIFLVVILLTNFCVRGTAQLVSGPMLGYVEQQEVCIWLEAGASSREIAIRYWPVSEKEKVSEARRLLTNPGSNQPVHIVLTGLQQATGYEYAVYLDGKLQQTEGALRFRTRQTWAKWSKVKPLDFSFLIGSCVYLNDSAYDRPATKPYGQDPSILKTMAKTPADFMIWTGDNLYYREADWTSRSGIYRRNSVSRSNGFMQELLSVRPNYAIWDDHDFGPNDANSSFELKHITREAFIQYWANKTYGENNQGIYSKFSVQDAEFFLLDDRWFRDANQKPDSIDGKPNPEKRYLGEQQLNWLKNALISSEYPFKFIINGNQITNGMADKECMSHFPADYLELMEFIGSNKINGVFFISGDRHFTELLKTNREKKYPLYEYTNSPVSSDAYRKITESSEAANPLRVQGSLYADNTYGRISLSGSGKERSIQVETLDRNGKVVFSHTILATELGY